MNTVVVGAGATGLAAAYLLVRAGHKVTIVESAPRPGGLLATFDVGDGARLEYFYHHFFTHDAEINWLLKELNLTDKVTFKKTSMGVFRSGKLWPFNGIKDLLKFRAISLLARLRFGFSSAMLSFLPGYADAEDTPTLQWMDRWAGRAATDAIWRPLMQSKFGEIAARVPLAWMAGRLRQRARSRKGGEEQLAYITGSYQVLVDAWVAELQRRGVEFRLNTPVNSLLTEQGKVVGVETDQGVIRGDVVLVTTPTPVISKLVRPLDSVYADSLDEIKYLGAICVVLGMKKPLSQTYWLNVADPGYDFGGVIEQTNFVGPENYGGRHIAYFSRYLNHSNPLWTLPDADLICTYVSQAERLYARPIRQDIVQAWVFRGTHAAPKTELGFHRLIPKFCSPIPGLTVASMPHVYPDERSVNNSIRVAAEAVRTLDASAADAVPRNMSLSAKYGPD